MGILNGKEIIEGEKQEIEKYDIYEGQSVFLKRNNFLEAWEISEFEKKETKAQFEEETDQLPY